MNRHNCNVSVQLLNHLQPYLKRFGTIKTIIKSNSRWTADKILKKPHRHWKQRAVIHCEWVKSCVLQGSVLVPLLFMRLFNGLPQSLNNLMLFYNAYDTIIILVSHKLRLFHIKTIGGQTKICKKRFSANELKLSPTKTRLLKFNLNHRALKYCSIDSVDPRLLFDQI